MVIDGNGDPSVIAWELPGELKGQGSHPARLDEVREGARERAPIRRSLDLGFGRGDAEGIPGWEKAFPEKVSRWAHGGRPRPRPWTAISAARSCLCKASAPGVRSEGAMGARALATDRGRCMTLRFCRWTATRRADGSESGMIEDFLDLLLYT